MSSARPAVWAGHGSTAVSAGDDGTVGGGYL